MINTKLKEMILSRLMLILIMILAGLSTLSAAEHVIIYWDAYESQAEQLADISSRQGDTVSIYPVSTLWVRENDELQKVTPVEGDDPQYVEYWDTISSLGLTTNSPYVMLYATMDDNNKSLKLYNKDYITLLGNPMEIPPSKILDDGKDKGWGGKYVVRKNGLQNHQGINGFPTDYYYGTKFSGESLEDYLLDVGISRLPVTLTNPITQQVTLTIDRKYASPSIVRGTPTLAGAILAGQYTNDSLYLDIQFDGSAENSYPYYNLIEGHTSTLSDGSIKIVATELEPETYSIADNVNFPYIIDRPKGEEARSGAYAYMSTTGDNVLEAFDVVSEGPRKVLVAETLGSTSLITLIDDSFEIDDVPNGSRLIIEDSGNEDDILDYTTGSGYSDASLVSGGNSLVIVVTSGSLAGSVYAVQSFDGNVTFNLAGGSSDQAPTNGVEESPLVGASARIYDFTAMRDYLNNNFNYSTDTRYITPTIFVDDETKTSQLASTGYIYHLQQSAQDLVDKLDHWENYISTFSPGGSNADADRVEYFQNALAISHEFPNRWEFFSETDIIDLINARDSINQGSNPSIFNGFNLTKAFQSNDGVSSDRLALKNLLEASVTFPNTNPDVGTLISNTGKVLIGQTDENGRFEVTVSGPTEDASFSVLYDVAFLETEVDDAILGQSSIVGGTTYLVQNTAGAAHSIAFTQARQIISNSGNTMARVTVSLLDEDEQVVNDSASIVDIALAGDGSILNFAGAEIGSAAFGFLTNGELSFTVSGNENLTLAVSDRWASNGFLADPGIIDDVATVFEIQDLSNLGNEMAGVRILEEGRFLGYNDTIKYAIQVIDNQGRAVPEERRVTFRIGGGKNIDVIDAMNHKGLIYASSDWVDDVFGASKSFERSSDYADNNNGVPDLPFMISSGYDGMSLYYNRFSVETRGGYGQASTTWGNLTTGGNYTGTVGYIGHLDLGLVQYQPGTWDKGEFTTDYEQNNRMLLARETLRQYSTAAQPRLGSVYRQGIEAYLNKLIEVNDNPSDADYLGDQSLEEVAEAFKTYLELWQLCGMSAMQLPFHIPYPLKSGLNDEVPTPSLQLDSVGLRENPEFDRFESYLIEVPKTDDNSGTVNVTISVNNHNDMLSFDSNMEYRYTLTPVAMNQPKTDVSQNHARITELDFYPDVTRDEIFSTNISSANFMTYQFTENWEANTSGNLTKRGPSLYMVKVEAREKQRSGDGLTDTQKVAQFTKEKRLFFKIVNEFEVEPKALFLLINNTDQDPFRQDNSDFLSDERTDYRVPSTAIRYYEDALDNYNYTKGTVSVSVTSNSASSFDITANEPEDMHWENRVFEGDKIRFEIPDSTEYTPWLRVSDVDSDGTTITVENNGFLVKSGNVKTDAKYIVQRAYTHGYATIDYTVGTPNVVESPITDTTITITIPTDKIDGFEQCVEVGDYFKFLDERVYTRITGISAGVVNGTDTIYTLTLAEAYPFINVWTYYSNNELWGGSSKINLGSAGTYTGSYSIYPADPDDASLPNYLYQTWNIHNYNTSNGLGSGLHGDIEQDILDLFDDGDDNGFVHRAVIWASDAGYGEIKFTPGRYTRRESNNSGFDTQIWRGKPRHYLSDKDEVLLSGFLGRGGRLMMSGQKLRRSTRGDSSFFEERIGVTASSNSGIPEAAGITQEPNDPISNVFSSEVSLQTGFAEGNKNTIELESTLTNANPFDMSIEEGRAMPFLYYSSTNTTDNDQIAAVRTSGGSNIAPYASVFMGFDFSNVYRSGAPNVDFSRESPFRGRNLLMKQSVDWLRNPSLTSDDRALRIIYEAEDFDGSKISVALDKASRVTVNSSLHLSANLQTQVGVNQELAFIAQNGKLYGETLYTWTVTENKNGSFLIQDPNEPNNDDWHKVIFKTGSQANEQYEINVRSPDGGETSIVVDTTDATLFFRLDTSDANIINDKMIYDPAAIVNFFAFGGSGLGSYNFFTRDGGIDFAQDNFLDPGQRNVFYNMPDTIAKLNDEVVVSIEVQSGSQVATDSITVLPPVEIDSSNSDFLVEGGAALSIFSTGGSTSDYVPSVSDNTVVVAATVDGTNNVTVAVLDDAELSTDPNEPTIVDLTVSDPIYESSDNLELLVYASPSFEHATISSNGSFYVASETEFEELTDAKKVFNPKSGEIPIKVIGGTGTYTVSVTKVTDNIPSTEILSTNTQAYDLNQAIPVTYTGNSQLILSTGNNTGTVSLRVTTEGGSQKTVNFSIVSPVSVKVDTSIYNTSSTLRVKPGANVLLSAFDGVEPYTWTLEPNTLGKFGTSPTSANLTTIQANDNESFYFVGSSSLIDGKIRVVDSQENFALLSVKITNVEPLEFREDSEDLMKSMTIFTSSRGTAYTFKGGLAQYSVRVEASDPSIKVSKRNSYSSASISIDLDESDALEDSDGSNYYRFYFFPRQPDSRVRLIVEDGDEAQLSSQDIVIEKASSLGIVDDDIPSSSGGGGGGGGGGCLLR